MKTAELKATVRKNTGAHDAKKLRDENKIPAVIYGESGNEHVEVDYVPMAKLIQSPDLFLINLEANGNSKRVIIQDTQFHPITDQIIHVDFLEAAVGRAAKLSVPVKIVGTSKGVLNGGMLVVKMRHLRIKGVPAELPEAIEVDITDLEIGKSIKVKDLEGFEFLDPENSVIVRVKTARKLEEIAPVLDEEEGEEGEEGAAEGEESAEGDAPKAEGEGADAAPSEEKSE